MLNASAKNYMDKSEICEVLMSWNRTVFVIHDYLVLISSEQELKHHKRNLNILKNAEHVQIPSNMFSQFLAFNF